MKYIISREKFINESFVDKNGNLRDVDWTPNSEMLWNDKVFIEKILAPLKEESEMPLKLYRMLTQHHKDLYMNLLLTKYELVAFNSEVPELVRDLTEYNPSLLTKKCLEYINQYSDFGNTHLPFSDTFIANLDEITQGSIVQRFISEMDYPIEINDESFECFHPNVQKMIEEHPETFDFYA